MIFGENLLALLVLALGAALAVGNLMALIRPRPPESDDGTELERAPLGRSLVMIALGLIAAIWALASLASADSADDEPSALSAPTHISIVHG